MDAGSCHYARFLQCDAGHLPGQIGMQIQKDFFLSVAVRNNGCNCGPCVPCDNRRAYGMT